MSEVTKEIKIEDLHLNQKVYQRATGQEWTIHSLTLSSHGPEHCGIQINHEYLPITFTTLDSLRQYYTLTPPKKKKRYWIWTVKPRTGCHREIDYYMDDEGFDTDRNSQCHPNFLFKKHEDRYVDIEE